MYHCKTNSYPAWVALSVCVFCHVAGAEDYALPHGPYSEEIEHFQGTIEGIDDFSVFSTDDVTLKVAYQRLFQCIVGDEFHSEEPEMVAAFADLRARGDAAAPMLLKLMEENQENNFESSILSGITGVDTINPEPFVEYARTVLRERTATMNALLAGHAARLLQKRGSSEDLQLLRWVVETRPFVAASVQPSIRALDLRLAAEKKPEVRSAEEKRNSGERATKGVKASPGQSALESLDEGTVAVKRLRALGLLTAALLISVAARLWLRRGKART
jgi:hypothetical protein